MQNLAQRGMQRVPELGRREAGEGSAGWDSVFAL